MAQQQHIVLTDDLLQTLSKRADILRIFPYMRLNLPTPRGGCKCNRKAVDRQLIAKEMSRVKGTLARMDEGTLNRLKAILNTKTATLYWNDGTKVQRKDF
jgi:hypothetical protein